MKNEAAKGNISLGFIFNIHRVKVWNSKSTVLQFADEKFNKPDVIEIYHE
jgi:hypothetical protein